MLNYCNFSYKWSKLLSAVGVGLMAHSLGFSQTNMTTANHVNQIITDYGGYWSSTGISNTVRPNNRHNVVGFQFGGTVYSTGVNDALLTAQGVTYTPAQFRALPFPVIGGTVSGNNVFIVAGSHLDGNPSTGVVSAPTIANLTAKEVLMDGVRGLDIGTGITNITGPALTLDVSVTDAAKINDDVPDFLMSQVADPSTSGFDKIAFLNEAGAVVGVEVSMNYHTLNPVGRYDMDLFTLPTGQSYDTAKPVAFSITGNTYRDIWLVGIKMSQLGITAENMHLIRKIRITKGGNADPAFYAFNEQSISIGGIPTIVENPISANTCTDGTESVTFTVDATGGNLNYQWRFNSVDIPGATSASYTVSDITQANSGEYSVRVYNDEGAVLSSIAYLNVRIPSNFNNYTLCSNATEEIKTFPIGTDLRYQWYSNTTNSYTGATLLTGQTTNQLNYSEQALNTTMYYFLEVYSEGVACNAVRSNIFAINRNANTVAGTATTTTPTVCYGQPIQLSVSGYQGNIRWQTALESNPTAWSNISGAAGSSPTLTYTSATPSRRFRVEVSNGGCTTRYTNSVVVNVTTNLNWTGAEDANWNNPANWTCNAVPTADTNVTIPVLATEVYPTVTTATVGNLTVEEGANLTVTGTLNLHGNLTNNGTFDSSAATINFASTAARTVSGELTARRLLKSNAGTVTLNGPVYVSEVVEFSNGTLASDGHLTLGSNASQTAYTKLTGAAVITGEVTVERYLGARRAYRHLSTSVSGGTVFDNWQEGGSSQAGYGLFITGSGSTAAGFDATAQNSPSLFTLNTTSGAFDEITNTQTTTLEAGKGYRLYVRGDRTINLNSNSAVPTPTVLRSKGTLQQTDFAVTDLNQNLNGWSLVGNPHQNQFNLQTVLNASTGLNKNYVWVWDPYVNTRGAYVIVDVTANTNNVSGSQANRTLLAGESVMVRTTAAAPSLTFTKANWTNGHIEPSIFSTAQNQMRMTLLNAANNMPLDGILVHFGEAYDSAITEADASKLSNQDETIAIRENDRNYGIQYRQTPVADERIALYHANYRHTDYIYQVELTAYDGPQAYLFDAVTQNYTALNNGLNHVPFTVGANEPTPRFEIVFEPSTLSTGNWSASDVRVYPNPVKDDQFTLNHPAGEVQQVRLINMLGQAIGVQVATISDTTSVVRPQNAWAAGVYTLEITLDGKLLQTKIIID